MSKGFKKVNFKDLSAAEKITIIPIVIIILAVIMFIENWALMIFVGSLHSLINVVPALSFWAVFWINTALGIIYKAITNSHRLI